MRLELSFSLKYPKLPVDNKRIWISFLKNCLSQSGDGRFYHQYFEGTPNKDYTFSIVLPTPEFQDNIMHFEKKII